jgi:hypothetical protein
MNEFMYAVVRSLKEILLVLFNVLFRKIKF